MPGIRNTPLGLWEKWHSLIKVGLLLLLALGLSGLVWILCYKFNTPVWVLSLCYGTVVMIITALVIPFTEDYKGMGAKILKAGIVAILVALAGLLTTWGWDARGKYYEDKQQLVAIAVELTTNQVYSDLNKYLLSRGYETAKSKVPAFSLYRFQNTMTRRAIVQNEILRADADLIRSLNMYVLRIDGTNNIFDLCNRTISSPIGTTIDVTTKVCRYRIKDASKHMEKLLVELNNIESMLNEKHTWAMDKAKEVDLEQLRKEEVQVETKEQNEIPES